MKENAIRMLCFNIFFESLTVFVLYYQPFFFRFLAKNDKKNSLSEILHFLTPTDIFIAINSSHYIIWFEEYFSFQNISVNCYSYYSLPFP